jgi:hypothetical protein
MHIDTVLLTIWKCQSSERKPFSGGMEEVGTPTADPERCS